MKTQGQEWIKGKISDLETQKNDSSKIVGYKIEDTNGNLYYAHLGDTEECAKFIYKLRDHKLEKIYSDFDKIELKKGQKVEFRKWTGNSGGSNQRREHVYSVKKVQKE